MRPILVVLILLALAAAYLVFGPRQTSPALRRDLTPPVLRMLAETLLHQGFDEAMLFVYVEGDPRFLQFMKSTDGNSGARIRSDFPLTDWSEPYYQKVRALLEARQIAFTETPGAGGRATHGALPSAVLVIDFGTNIDQVSGFVRDVFVEVYGVDPADGGVAWLERFSNLPRRNGGG